MPFFKCPDIKLQGEKKRMFTVVSQCFPSGK